MPCIAYLSHYTLLPSLYFRSQYAPVPEVRLITSAGLVVSILAIPLAATSLSPHWPHHISPIIHNWLPTATYECTLPPASFTARTPLSQMLQEFLHSTPSASSYHLGFSNLSVPI